MNLEILPSESQVMSTMRAVAIRLRVEPVDRHDREQLPERPVIEQRLENGEVADVLIAERRLELLHFLRHVAQALVQGDDLLGELPVDALDLRFALEIEQPEREHLLRLFLDLLRIVQRLAPVVLPQLLLHVEDVADELVIRFGELELRLERTLLDRAKRFDHEHRMMRDDRAAALADDAPDAGRPPSRRRP